MCTLLQWLTLQGLKRTTTPSTNRAQCLPITNHILQQLIHALNHYKRVPRHDHLMLQAELLLGFFGFLRVSELAVPNNTNFTPAMYPTLDNVSLHHRYLNYCLKRSKTDQAAQGYTITVGVTGNSLCPVHVHAFKL